MDKLLIFNEQGTTASIGDAAHDVAGYLASGLVGITNLGTTDTEIELLFRSMETPNDTDVDACDNVKLTITANKHVEVMEAIAKKIAEPISKDGGAIVVFDAERSSNKSDVSEHITGCTITVQAAD